MGGAIDPHCSHGQIVNCTFANNHAVNGGGAVYMKNGRNNTLKDCTFTNNTAPVGGAFALSPNYHDALLFKCRSTRTQQKLTEEQYSSATTQR